MSRRVCTTQPGDSTCCRAARAGRIGPNNPIRIPTRNGERCGVCEIVTKRNGRPGFRFHFASSALCGIGPSGCDALAQMGQGGGIVSQLGLRP